MNGAPMCSRCRTRILDGSAEPNPQGDLFSAPTFVHAGKCPERDPVMELLLRSDRDGARFRRLKIEARTPRSRPRLSRHILGGGL